VLYALGEPVSFVLLVLSFLVAVTLQGWVQSTAAARAGDGRPRLEGRLRPDPRRHVDPFGAIAAAISGIGWARQVEPPVRRARGTVVAVLLSGAVVNVLVGLATLVGFRLAGGLAGGGSSEVLQRGVDGGDLGLVALYLFGLMNLFVGVLSLVPLPPLPGGSVLFALAPSSTGWRKAEYRLVEQNIGVAVLLALLIIPLGGPQAILPTVLDEILAEPLRALLSG